MLANDLQDLLGITVPKSLQAAKEMVKDQEKNLAVLESKVKRNKEHFSDEEMSKFDEQMKRISELKKEIDGLRTNK